MQVMQKYLGQKGGKTKMTATIFSAYLLNALLFILPLGNPWVGVENNGVFLFVIAPFILFFGSQLLFGICSAAFKVFILVEDKGDR